MHTLPAILVVDDDPTVLETFKAILKKDYVVCTTQSSFHALDLIKKGNRFSAIIYNYYMPSMNGKIFFSRIRNITVATRILLAPSGHTDLVITALNQGGISFFIGKPLEKNTIEDIVQRAIVRCEYRRNLRHDQLLLQGLLDHLPYGVAFKDGDGKFIRMNELAAARRGLSIEECVGKTEEETEPSFTYEELQKFNTRLREEERFVEMLEVPSKNLYDSSQWFVITRLLLGRAKGDVARPSVLMELDITDQKKIEARLHQSEKLQALGTMAGGVAHDFNNLLTTIIGSFELIEYMLQQVQTDQKQLTHIHRLLGNALAAAQKGSVLTERLLSFSRKKSLSLQKVDVYQELQSNYELLKQTLKMRQSVRTSSDEQGVAHKKTVILEMNNYIEDSILVRTDPSQLELAVMNLCINSLDAMNDDGRIDIRLSKERVNAQINKHNHLPLGDYVVITVKDSGGGMSPETVAHIFEPFFTTKEIGLGTGLGLPMVYGFAQQSGGDVIVKSQLGKGTEISIYLPICKEDSGV